MTINIKDKKDNVRHKVLEGERKDNIIKWVSFFRRNPHRFVTDYFGIHLHPFQVLMIWMLQRSNLAYIVASRAASKTWIIAIWAMTLCVLYPGIKVITCSKTLRQGSLIIGKINDLMNTYPNITREIKAITVNANNAECTFHCGSSIKALPSTESARGNRANYIIIEESRLVPKEILEQVIKPMLSVRTPPYKNKSEYRNDPILQEEPIISYITSAWYKTEYWYTYVKSAIRRMTSGDETANFLALDYLITIYHNIKTEETIKNEMADMDSVSIQMEYLNIPSGSSGKSYFKSSMFPRTIKRAFYPQKLETFNPKKNPYEIKKVEKELRFVSIDVATRSNKANDLTIISCIRLIPSIGKGYERSLMYMESHKGANTVVQAKRIKEIFFDFESDYLVIDIQNAGIN